MNLPHFTPIILQEIFVFLNSVGSFQIVVRNSINIIDTWYCHWNSDQKWQKKKIIINGSNREMEQMLKKPKKFEVRKSKYVTNL